MQLCYVDESGTTEMLVDKNSAQQPVIVIAGVALPESGLAQLTHDWIKLKNEYHPSTRQRGHGWLDAILFELKGTTVRKGLSGNATLRQRKNALAFQVRCPRKRGKSNYPGNAVAWICG